MTPKEWRHIHGSSGLNFDLADVRESYATCVEFEHLPELKTAKDRCEKILDEVEGGNYKRLYDAAASSVSLRDAEVDRLQQAIFESLSYEKAVEIIDAAPIALGRRIIRDSEAAKLKQKLDVARAVRDKIVTKSEIKNEVDRAYQIVAAQGSVNQAKKALYVHLRAIGRDTKHKDL